MLWGTSGCFGAPRGAGGPIPLLPGAARCRAMLEGDSATGTPGGTPSFLPKPPHGCSPPLPRPPWPKFSPWRLGGAPAWCWGPVGAVAAVLTGSGHQILGFWKEQAAKFGVLGRDLAAQFQALRGYRTAGSPHVPNAASLRGETCRNWGEIGVKSGRNWGEITSFAAPPAAQAAAVGLERGKGSRPPAAGALRLILGGKIWPKIRCRGQARCRCSAFSPGTAEGPRCRPASRS